MRGERGSARPPSVATIQKKEEGSTEKEKKTRLDPERAVEPRQAVDEHMHARVGRDEVVEPIDYDDTHSVSVAAEAVGAAFSPRRA